MKKKGLICLLMASLFLTGCSNAPGLKADEIENSTLVIDKKGIVQGGVVESFDKEYYSKEELEDWIDEWIESYNSSVGENRVKLKSFLADEKNASMVVQYDTIEDYAAVNQVEAGILSFDEAKSQNILPETLVSMEAGNSVETKELEADPEWQVLFLTEEYDIILEGKVLYYQNAAIKSTDSVHTTGNETAVIIFKK